MSSSIAQRQEVDERWSAAGEHYRSGRWKGSRAEGRDRRLITKLLERISNIREVRRTLDVPSGTGRLQETLYHCPLLVQADISMSMLAAAHAEDRYRDDEELAVPRLQASVTELPFQDGAFDLIVCCRLLHHLESKSDRLAVLKELARVSSQYVIASYWDSASYQAWRKRTKGPLKRRKRPDVRAPMDYEQLRSELDEVGLTPLSRSFSMRFISQQTFVLAKRS